MIDGDFLRGFIKAEIVSCHDLVAHIRRARVDLPLALAERLEAARRIFVSVRGAPSR